MGVRAFRDDVAAARVQDLGNITDVGRGDGDGEVAFKYTHDDLLQPLLIRLIGGKQVLVWRLQSVVLT